MCDNKKPPLGLSPKYIHRTERLKEIRKAMLRYINASKEAPVEWIEEYNELIEYYG